MEAATPFRGVSNTKTTGSSLVEPYCSHLAPTLEGEPPKRKLPLPLEVSKHEDDRFVAGRTLLLALGAHARGEGVLSGSCHSLSRCLNTKTIGSSLAEPCCSHMAPTLEGEAS